MLVTASMFIPLPGVVSPKKSLYRAGDQSYHERCQSGTDQVTGSRFI